MESGTGSGALSMGIARCIMAGGPGHPGNGRLLTFEFHPVRAQGARYVSLRKFVSSHHANSINCPNDTLEMPSNK